MKAGIGNSVQLLLRERFTHSSPTAGQVVAASMFDVVLTTNPQVVWALRLGRLARVCSPTAKLGCLGVVID
jgi:hypothetical protein